MVYCANLVLMTWASAMRGTRVAGRVPVDMIGFLKKSFRRGDWLSI